MTQAENRIHRSIALALGAVSLVATLVATLIPIDQAVPNAASLCIVCGELGGTDFVLNILLSVPLGFAIGLYRGWWWTGLAAIIALSLGIELLQIKAIAGRDASLGDWIANSAGGALGMGLGAYADALALPNARWARRFAAGGAAVVGLLLVATSRLLQPSLPFLVYWVQFQPVRRGFDTFPGHIDSLTVNGEPLAAASPIDPLFRPSVLMADRQDVRSVVRPGPPPPSRIAFIARLANPGSEAFMVGRYGNDLVYRARLAAADARMRVPIAALSNAFGVASETDTSQVELQTGLEGDSLMLAARGPRGETQGVVLLTPALLWSLLLPRDMPLGGHYLWINALFLAVLTLPVFYWITVSATARTTRAATLQGRAKSLILAGSFLLILGIVPPLAGAAAFGTVEWLGVAASLVAAAALARLSYHARRRRSALQAAAYASADE